MRFLFLLKNQIVKTKQQTRAVLNPSQIKRLSTVLRLREGDNTFVRILPDGRLFNALIVCLGKSKGELVLFPDEVSTDIKRYFPSCKLSIGLSVIKKKNFELVIQKASELGVSTITPLTAQRSDSHILRSPAGFSKRFSDIAQEACMQSGRPVPIKIADFQAPLVFVEKAIQSGDEVIVLHEGDLDSKAISGKDFSNFVSSKNSTSSVSVLIGPEGGFTSEEIALFQKAGAKIKRLHGFILRAETAAIMIASIFSIS